MTYSCCLAMPSVLVLCCMVQSRSLSTCGMVPACADRTAALITSKKREIRYLTLRRAPVDVGGLYLAKQAKSGAAEPHEICSSSCTKCEWNSATKARKKTDFVQEINNASLINHTLITRCPPSQPLCNLWTSLLDFYVR